MKKIILIYFTILNVSLSICQNTTCYFNSTQNSISTNNILTAASCNDYNDYIPNPNDAVQIIRINLHVLQQSTNNPQNFTDNAFNRQLLASIIGPVGGNKGINRIFNHSSQPVLGGMSGGSYLENSKIQFELQNIFFHVDNNGWNLNNSNLCGNYCNSVYGSINHDVLDVFFVESNGFTANGGCGNPANWQNGPYVNYSGLFSSDWLNHTNYTEFPEWGPSVQLLAHEVGHTLGLMHTFSPDTYTDTPNPGGNGWCDPFDAAQTTCSNNVMSYSKDKSWFSPMQMGDMHRILFNYMRARTKYCDYDQNNNFIIDNNQTWNKSEIIPGDLIINKGSTLTINCKVMISNGGKIVVKPGGKLIIDGGYLSTECENLWQGIEVWGDPSKNQTSFDAQGIKWQGVVQMKNGAIIENAYIGILANNGTSNAGGGILDIQNSTFRNCWKSIEVNAYPNFQNLSMIKRNTFETTHILSNGQWPEVFIDGYQFKGLKIYGNTFSFNVHPNEMPEQMHNYGTGIYLESAQALINGIATNGNINYCDPTDVNWTPNKFEGLFRGVVLKNLGLNYTSVVNKNYFKNCVLAISNDGMNATTITQNRIELGNAPNQGAAIVNGILQSVGTGFKIEANCIERLGNNFINSAGIIVNNTGGDNNTVYRNISIGNKTAFLSNEKNRSSTPDAGGKFRGLQFKCNQNTNNANSQDYDIAVATNTTGSTDPLLGIRYYQGGNGTSSNPQAAGNEFTPQAVNIYNNTLNPIVYFYDPLASNQSPTNYSWNITPSSAFVQPNQCQSTIGSGGGGLLNNWEYNQLLANFTIHNSQFLAAAIFYNNIIDGGSTQNLLQSITNNSKMSVNEIRNLLLNNSPNVSEGVLREAAVSNTLLTNADLLEIIAANPDVAHNEELLYMLQNKANPMDEWMIEFLREAGTYETNRTLLEQTFAQKQAERDADAWGVVRHLLSDTLNDTLNHAELRSWLWTIGSPRAKYMIADDYASLNNYDAAISIVKQMTDKELDRYELTERNGMLQWYSLLKQMYDHGNNMTEITEQLQVLVPLANNQRESGLAGIIAANVLNKFLNGSYVTEIVYPENSSTARLVNTTSKKQRTLKRLNGNIQSQLINDSVLFPNPANDFVTIDLSQYSNLIQIKVYNLDGKFMIEQNVKGLNKITIDVNSFSNGTYYVQFIENTNKLIGSSKLEVMHIK
jgi:hypothetical protein